MRRPWKLKSYVGGLHGTVDRTRSFATREARDAAIEEARRAYRTVSVWKASGPPSGAPR